jgi:hypothetical protein
MGLSGQDGDEAVELNDTVRIPPSGSNDTAIKMMTMNAATRTVARAFILPAAELK